MSDMLTSLIDAGVIGTVAAIAFWYAWRKDKKVTALYEQMIANHESNCPQRSNLTRHGQRVEELEDIVRTQAAELRELRACVAKTTDLHRLVNGTETPPKQ